MRTLLNSFLLVALALPLSAQASEGDLPSELLALFEQEDDYVALRSQAVENPEISDEELGELSEHPDWRVRVQAEIVLGWRLDPELFSAVVTARPVVDRAQRRVRFLSEPMKQPLAAPAVVERLLHGTDSELVAVGLAGRLIHLRVGWGDDLVALLGVAESPEVRETLVWGLRHAESAVAQHGLRIALQDPAAQVRAEAARSAGWRADGGELAPELIAALGDDTAEPRAMAARALGWLGVVEAADSLAERVDDSDAGVRLHALRALDRVSPAAAESLPQLAALLQDSDPKVARVARRIGSR